MTITDFLISICFAIDQRRYSFSRSIDKQGDLNSNWKSRWRVEWYIQYRKQQRRKWVKLKENSVVTPKRRRRRREVY